MPTSLTEGHGRSTGLVEVLDRVLDKGLVVAGDIKVSLAEVELLTIRIRLLICSITPTPWLGYTTLSPMWKPSLPIMRKHL